MYKNFTIFSTFRVVLFAIFLQMNAAIAQVCADVDATDVTVKSATCPGNGSITLPTLPSGTVYQLSGAPLSGNLVQSSPVFESLSEGTYTVTLICANENATSFDVVVPNEHSPLGMDFTAEMPCENEGTITANGTGGYNKGNGTTYRYVLWPEAAGGANRPDSDLTYGTINTWSGISTGNYYLRVKDECGNIYTEFFWIEPVKPAATLVPGNPSVTCSNNGKFTYTYPNARLVSTRSEEGIYDVYDTPVYKYKVDKISSSGNCATATVMTPDVIPVSNIVDGTVLQLTDVVQGERYRITIISPCDGSESVTCVEIGDAFGFEAKPSRLCAPTSSGNTRLTLNVYEIGYTLAFNGTVTITGTGISPAITRTVRNWTDLSAVEFVIPETAYPLTVSFTDACGASRTTTVTMPVMGADPDDLWYVENYECVSENGLVNISVWPQGNWYGLEYNSGNDADKTKYELVNASSGVTVATLYGLTYVTNNQLTFKNVPAGADYFVRITPPNSVSSTCPPQESNDMNVPLDEGLDFTVNPTLGKLCGSGLNYISYNIEDNSNYDIEAKLYSGTDASGTLVSSILDPWDLPAGEYYYVITRPNANRSCTITREGPITIANWALDPSITRSLSVNCQQVGSGPQNTGSAMLQFSGYGPFVVERSVNGGPYSVVAQSAASSYTEPSLAAGSVYNYRVTDQCGKSVSQQVMIKPLSPRITSNTVEPCKDQPYILSGIDFGDPLTTYKWEKVGTAGVLATTKDYTIPNFTEGDNGSYKLTITLLGGCVVREAILKLNSTNCGQEFATGSLGDKVWFDTNSDGIQDVSEAGVPGVPVKLQSYVGPPAASASELADSNNWTEIKGAVTDGNGNYLFDGLETGYYRVNFGTVPNFGFTSYMQGSDAALNSDAGVGGFSGPVFINADGTGIDKDNMTVDAGLVPAGSIGDYVWNDDNSNGKQDAGETPISGSAVRLYVKNVSGGWDLWGSTVTDANGKYLFDGLPTGTYQVEFALPSGLVFTYANAVSALDTEDSDADMTTGRSGEISINTALAETDNGRNNMTIDAGVTVKLPVKLASFEVKKGEGFSSTLKWTTTEEVNSSKFEIQRSPDAKTWSVIGSVAAQENSVGMVHYRYNDMNVLLGMNYYRLKMIDTDGSFSYSTVRKLSADNDGASIVLYPNPVLTELSVISNSGIAISKIELINSLGKVMVSKRESSMSSTIEVKSLPIGVYVARISFQNGSTEYRKVVIGR